MVHSDVGRDDVAILQDILTKVYDCGKFKTFERVSGQKVSFGDCNINVSLVPREPHADLFSLNRSDEYVSKIIRKETSFSKILSYGLETHPGAKCGRILISGRAGIGKSTFCKKIIYKYYLNQKANAKKKNQIKIKNQNQDIDQDEFQNYTLILYISLRSLLQKLEDPNGGLSQTSNLLHVFHAELFSGQELDYGIEAYKFSQLLFSSREIRNTSLFLLDGYEEIENYLEKYECLFELLDQQNIVVTSRPSAVLLRNITFQATYEIMGFSQADIKSYLKSNMPDTWLEILHFINQKLAFRGLTTLPILLDIICYSWDVLCSFKGPMTMTTLFDKCVHKMFSDELGRKKRKGTKSDKQGEKFKFLFYRLAYQGLQNNCIEFSSSQITELLREFNDGCCSSTLNGTTVTYGKSEIEAFLTFGQNSHLITCLNPLQEIKEKRIYTFSHLLFQEYFAAECYSKILFNTTKRDDVKMGKFNPRLQYLWSFVAGIFSDIKDGRTTACLLLDKYLDLVEMEPVDVTEIYYARLLFLILNECYLSVQERRQEGFTRYLLNVLRRDVQTVNLHFRGVVFFPAVIHALSQYLMQSVRDADSSHHDVALLYTQDYIPPEILGKLYTKFRQVFIDDQCWKLELTEDREQVRLGTWAGHGSLYIHETYLAGANLCEDFLQILNRQSCLPSLVAEQFRKNLVSELNCEFELLVYNSEWFDLSDAEIQFVFNLLTSGIDNQLNVVRSKLAKNLLCRCYSHFPSEFPKVLAEQILDFFSRGFKELLPSLKLVLSFVLDVLFKNSSKSQGIVEFINLLRNPFLKIIKQFWSSSESSSTLMNHIDSVSAIINCFTYLDDVGPAELSFRKQATDFLDQYPLECPESHQLWFAVLEDLLVTRYDNELFVRAFISPTTTMPSPESIKRVMGLLEKWRNSDTTPRFVRLSHRKTINIYELTPDSLDYMQEGHRLMLLEFVLHDYDTKDTMGEEVLNSIIKTANPEFDKIFLNLNFHFQNYPDRFTKLLEYYFRSEKGIPRYDTKYITQILCNGKVFPEESMKIIVENLLKVEKVCKLQVIQLLASRSAEEIFGSNYLTQNPNVIEFLFREVFPAQQSTPFILKKYRDTSVFYYAPSQGSVFAEFKESTNQTRVIEGLHFFQSFNGLTHFLKFADFPVEGIKHLSELRNEATVFCETDGHNIYQVKAIGYLCVVNMSSESLQSRVFTSLQNVAKADLQNIVHLDLSFNQIGDNEIAKIVACENELNIWSCLVSLNLSNNQITDKGFRELIESNLKVEYLILRFNYIQFWGKQREFFFENLKNFRVGTNIVKIDLSFNFISPDCENLLQNSGVEVYLNCQPNVEDNVVITSIHNSIHLLNHESYKPGQDYSVLQQHFISFAQGWLGVFEKPIPCFGRGHMFLALDWIPIANFRQRQILISELLWTGDQIQTEIKVESVEAYLWKAYCKYKGTNKYCFPLNKNLDILNVELLKYQRIAPMHVYAKYLTFIRGHENCITFLEKKLKDSGIVEISFLGLTKFYCTLIILGILLLFSCGIVLYITY